MVKRHTPGVRGHGLVMMPWLNAVFARAASAREVFSEKCMLD